MLHVRKQYLGIITPTEHLNIARLSIASAFQHNKPAPRGFAKRREIGVTTCLPCAAYGTVLTADRKSISASRLARVRKLLEDFRERGRGLDTRSHANTNVQRLFSALSVVLDGGYVRCVRCGWRVGRGRGCLGSSEKPHHQFFSDSELMCELVC